MKLTNKQIQIMQVIVKGEGLDAEKKFIPVDLDQLLERLPYKTTKASIQFSIRALVAHDLIHKAGQEVRRGRQRVLLSPTERGKASIAWTQPESILEPENLSAAVSLQDLLA
jgi:DNA-binding MarR family transcriptional regulator